MATNQSRPTSSGPGLLQQRNRSCEECNRKKSKCDRKTPQCSRCRKSNRRCTYPNKRKLPTLETQLRSLQRKLIEAGRSEELDQAFHELDSSRLPGAGRGRQDEPFVHALHHSPSISTASPTNPGIGGDILPETPWTADASQRNTNQPAETCVYHDIGGSIPENIDSAFEDLHQGISHGPFDLVTSDGGWLEINGMECSQSPVSDPSQDPAGILTDKHTRGYSIPLPTWIVDDLIKLFFKKVQCFIPLFHDRDFHSKFGVGNPDETRYCKISIEDAFILNGMFALSARFSSSSYFGDLPPKARARVFGCKAKALYTEILQQSKVEQSSLSLLQGCILLSFYQLTSLPTTESWLLVGTCCRLAIDLGLDVIDEDVISSGLFYDANALTLEEWKGREEQRRAWWLVWELDIFASTISKRPYAIDRNQMHVLLPVSDKHWFSNRPLGSIPLKADTFQAWGSLDGCPNQDERVWFLLSTFLMATAHDLSLRRTTTTQELIDFQSTLDCFNLSLPMNFYLSSGDLNFTESNFASCNWVISTVFMLHTTKALLRRSWCERSQKQSSLASWIDNVHVGVCSGTDLVFRAAQAWLPEFIPYACPFIVCTIIGPQLDNLQTVHGMMADQHNSQLDLLKLVLRRVGAFWDIGTAALRIVQTLECEHLLDEESRDSDFPLLARSLSLLVHGKPH